VEDEHGRVIWEQEVERQEVMDSAAAFLITDMLEEAVEHGTARDVRRSGFRGPAAGKTGTTDDGADAWYVGYTTSHVAAVWIGFDRPRPIVENASGGRLAAPVWARVLREHATAGVWTTPSTIIQRRVDPASGLLLVDGCEPDSGSHATELFVRGDEPASACPAGEPHVEQRRFLRRVGGWFGRQWRGFSRWVTRHFGSEEPQRAPREGDYLGVPRLPRAAELAEPQVQADSFTRPLGVPIPEEPLPDTVGDTLQADSLRLDTLPLDTGIVRDSLRLPIPDSLPPVRPPPVDTTGTTATLHPVHFTNSNAV
jgi:membrane peptidoglycan carboxypeptidase